MRLRTTKEFTDDTKKSMVADEIIATLKWKDRLEMVINKLGQGGRRLLKFDDGPPPGKKWHIYINMSVVEVDDQ
jgi:hypothetical protein